MKLTEIDKNFKLAAVNEPDLEWHAADEDAFSLHGIYYDETAERYLRMPLETAKAVSNGVYFLTSHTAGGRLRFITDSPYVAIRCVAPAELPMPHMPYVGSHGFSLYADGKFAYMCAPSHVPAATPVVDGKIAFEGIRRFETVFARDIDLYFPLYNGVNKLFIGLKKGCSLQRPKPYKYQKPVLFYGSSITQGGCASRPGNDYISHLSRWLDCDILNLGFSGNAKGEQAMIDHLAAQDPAVYVIDYDHNAPTAEHLQATHLPLYEAIRKAHKNTPVIFISKPDCDRNPTDSALRRQVIYNTYLTAKKRGDKRVWFIDGQSFNGKEDRDACAVDTCHPNDLGFYRMAKKVLPVLKKALKKIK
ncbi:MAG: hypothetical protein IJX91_01795 [Clostridia bacterium]|nr:hypothetical protein [Clostridia bacterium]